MARPRIRPLAGVILTASGLLALGTAVVLALASPSSGLRWPPPAPALLLFGGSAVAVALVLNLPGIVRYLRGPRGRVFLNVTTMVVLALFLLAAGNWIASRNYLRADWTRSQLYGLSDKTQAILDQLEDPVRVLVFLPRNHRLYGQLRELLDRYEHASERVGVEYVNPDFDRARAELLAREFDVQQLDVVVVASGERSRQVGERDLVQYQGDGFMARRRRVRAFTGEQALTTAMLSVTQERQTRVLFLGGHGEHDIQDTDPRLGMSEAADALRAENLLVERLSLVEGGEVPEDADVVVVAGPRKDFLDAELEALDRYLERGGSLLVLIDPILRRSGPGVDAPFLHFDLGVEPLLERWNVGLQARSIYDPRIKILFQGPFVFVATELGHHPLTERLGDARVLLDIARPVESRRSRDDLRAYPLVRTSEQSWAVVSIEQLVRKGAPDPRVDVTGPFSVAVAVGPLPDYRDELRPGPEPPPSHPARLVVVGDSDFASNLHLSEFDNRALLLAAVHWLAGREELIAIGPREPENFRLSLTETRATVYSLIALEGLPLLVVLAGLTVWWSRRQ